MSKPGEWTLKWDHDFQYTDGVPASLIVASGDEIDEHKKVQVIEKTAHVSKCVNMHDDLLRFLAERVLCEVDCHCDPTDNFECNKHLAERLWAKAEAE